jgi:hypothetical protein
MITVVGDVTVGGGLTAAAATTTGINTLVGLTLPGISEKVARYTLLQTPSPSFDIATQLTTAGTNLTADLATVAALPGSGAAWATAISAGIAAMVSLRAADPALGARIDADVSAIAGLNAQISAGVSGPNVNLTLVATILSQLTALQAAIETQQSLAAGISANLGVSGLRLYRFDGDIATAGADLQARITSDGLSGEFHFMVLLPTSAPTWSALQATLRTG